MNSFAHKFEAPLVLGALFAAAGNGAWKWFVPGVAGIASTAFSVLAVLCLGWWMHLLGDFIEGGTGSLFVRGKIGCTWFKWTRYDGTFLGIFLDWILGVAAAATIAAVVFHIPPQRFALVPSLVSSHTNVNIPSGAGIFLVPCIWAFFMSWGRGGVKAFLARVVFLGFVLVAAFFAIRSL